MEPEEKKQLEEAQKNSIPLVSLDPGKGKIGFNAVSKLKEDKLTVETFTAKDFLLFQLEVLRTQIIQGTKKLSPKERSKIKELDRSKIFLNEKIEKLVFIKVEPEKHGIEFTYTSLEGAVITKEEEKELLLTPGYPIPYIATLLLYPETNNISEVKKGKYKRSSHLTDQILKYNYPKDKRAQLSLFDTLEDNTKKEIESQGLEISEIVEGIQLSPSETKIIDCLCKLLHHTSRSIDAKDIDSYGGKELVQYGENRYPKLAFSLYELTKEYKGGEYGAGKDIDNVRQTLTGLNSKQFLFKYVETTRKKDGGRKERKIERFEKLISILEISETEYSREDIELSKKEETVILLNPIFRSQIDSKFILYPNDINQRTILAYGSHNLSEVALRLRDELMRALSGKHYVYKIGLERLYYMLAEKWMKESRRKKVKEYTDKAIQTVKALGLLSSYEIKPGATGEPIVIFTLNKDWE